MLKKSEMCAQDSNQPVPVHPCSLMRDFYVCIKTFSLSKVRPGKILIRMQTDLNLRWTPKVRFLTLRLNLSAGLPPRNCFNCLLLTVHVIANSVDSAQRLCSVAYSLFANISLGGGGTLINKG